MADLKVDPALADTPDGPTVFVVAGRAQDADFLTGPHSHARGQLCASLRGLLSIGTDHGAWVLPAVHAMWLPPRHVHSARSHGPFDGWSAYVAEAACHDLPKVPCVIPVSGLLREAVLRASTWPVEPLDTAREHVVAVILDEIRGLPVETFGLAMPRDARLQRVARALMQDPADPRDIDQWAAWGAVSARTLSRRFVAETGFSFSAWRQRARLMRARLMRARLMRALELLADGLPVTAIALELGYTSVSAFIGLFRRTFGETPANYRSRASAP